MADRPFIARGFHGRRAPVPPGRLPPGQYETWDFPVLSAGPTPHTPIETWDFTIQGSDGRSVRWSWDEFRALPRETPTFDIHCVTKWSKFDTTWEGVSVDILLEATRASGVPEEAFVLALMTAALATCAGCKTRHPAGALLEYGQRMGVVLRCPACEAIMLRIAHMPGWLRVDFSGTSFLTIPEDLSP